MRTLLLPKPLPPSSILLVLYLNLGVGDGWKYAQSLAAL